MARRFIAGDPLPLFVDCPWRFDPSAHSKGKVLPGAYAFLLRDHNPGYDAESDLGDDEPEPIDPLVEHGIQRFEDAVDQPRPKDGGDHSSKQNRTARKHRKCSAVKKP